MKYLCLGLLIIICALVLWQSLFVVPMNEIVIVVRFGKPVVQQLTAGFHWRLPLIDQIVRYDGRIQLLEMTPLEIPTSDNKILEVGVSAYWQVTEPVALFRSLGTQAAATRRLQAMIESAVRDELARYLLVEIVRPEKRRVPLGQWQKVQSLANQQEQIQLAKQNYGAGRQIESQIVARLTQQLATEELGLQLLDLKIQHVRYLKSLE